MALIKNRILKDNLVGPVSSTDNALVVFDQSTGKVVENGFLLSDASNALKIPASTTTKPCIIFDSNPDLSAFGEIKGASFYAKVPPNGSIEKIDDCLWYTGSQEQGRGVIPTNQTISFGSYNPIIDSPPTSYFTNTYFTINATTDMNVNVFSQNSNVPLEPASTYWIKLNIIYIKGVSVGDVIFKIEYNGSIGNQTIVYTTSPSTGRNTIPSDGTGSSSGTFNNTRYGTIKNSLMSTKITNTISALNYEYHYMECFISVDTISATELAITAYNTAGTVLILPTSTRDVRKIPRVSQLNKSKSIDPHYDYVSLLMPMHPDQTPTFKDYSKYNRTITNVGGVTLAQISGLDNGAVIFNETIANSQRLTFPASSELDLIGDFTIECKHVLFQNLPGAGTEFILISKGVLPTYSYLFSINNITPFGMCLHFLFSSDGSAAGQVGHKHYVNVNTSFITGTYHRVIVQRRDSTITMSLNDVIVYTATDSAPIYVGGSSGGGCQVGGGTSNSIVTMDNLRLTTGVARYDAINTSVQVNPSYMAFAENKDTDPFFTYTELLLHMNGVNNGTTFTDSSSRNRPITRLNAPKTVTSQYKFDGSCAYFPAAGSSPLVSSLSTTATSFGTGDFTIECWYYPTSSSASSMNIFDQRGGAGNLNSTFLIRYNTLSRAISFVYGTTPTVLINPTPTSVLTLNQWNHIAITRTSGFLRIMVNGLIDYSVASITNDFSNVTGWFINNSGGASTDTYIDDFRVTIGVARYQGPSLPPARRFQDFQET